MNSWKKLKLKIAAVTFFISISYSFFYVMALAGVGNSGVGTDKDAILFSLLGIPPIVGFSIALYLIVTLNKKKKIYKKED